LRRVVRNNGEGEEKFKTGELKCAHCLKKAVTIYEGIALCDEHLKNLRDADIQIANLNLFGAKIGFVILIVFLIVLLAVILL